MTHTMKLELFIVVLLPFVCLINHVTSHSYHLGSCPIVEPMSDFSMERLLGVWYVVQKTSTGSKCLTYNFTATGDPYEYKIEQVSEHPVLGLVNVDNKYHYTGLLTVPYVAVPAQMTVRFPLSVAGSASYTVLMTDYEKYAAIFTCQKLAFANRQSATILSRSKTLDKIYLDKIRNKLSSFGVDPYELSVIDQSGCPNDGVNINIDDDTFSPANIGNAVRKAGEKIGDGVEFAANGAKKVYNSVASKKNDNPAESRREEIIEDQTLNKDAEWLP